MKRLFLTASVLAFITMVTGTVLRIESTAMIGWALTVACIVCYLEYCDRDSKHRAERRAEELRRKHANDMDTKQFGALLTREQLMREYEKIKL